MADKAILFGINDYETISDLRGCVNDLDSIKRLLIDTFGFQESNIRTCQDDKVTKQAVTAGFDWLAEGSGPGDRLVFHFSGHGSYTQSESSDKTIDELICLYGMDWNNSDTFIRDTDLGKLTRKVDTGARLTVILDSCHSGSGTRAITAGLRTSKTVTSHSKLMIVEDTARQMTRATGIDHRERLLRSDPATVLAGGASQDNVVLARFVQPPAAIQRLRDQLDSVQVRKLGESIRAELNHQLLAAAQETQTAADAFIQGRFHGAFTFYFAECAKQSAGQGTFASVLEATRARLQLESYSQTPQLDGPFASELLFGGSADRPGGMNPAPSSDEDDEFSLTPPPAPEASPSAGIESSPAGVELLERFLRVTEKIVDLASARPARAPGRVGLARAAANEFIVYVHGISTHRTGYSQPWYDAVVPHLSRSIPRKEVLWSQHVNARSFANLPRADVQVARMSVEQELEQRMRRIEQHAEQAARGRGGATPDRPQRDRNLSVDDFARYMMVESTRTAILGEFRTIVAPLLQAGNTLHIVSHSWGTVVAYEGLRGFDSQPWPGKVANLFVAGSALSIGAVRSNLFGRVTDGRLPSHVRRVINLDAGGDIVGGPIGEHFTVDQEFLGLDPVGCRKILFTGIALNPSCAHSSYFRPENVAVNRDIFAAFIA